MVDTNTAEQLRDSLIGAGASPCGHEAAEILRIEAGIPRFGIDMDETKVVTETNLDDAVSFTKGCYIGQEIIARIKYRGHVAKKLTGVLLEQKVALEWRKTSLQRRRQGSWQRHLCDDFAPA